jgi:hypothetical protein
MQIRLKTAGDSLRGRRLEARIHRSGAEEGLLAIERDGETQRIHKFRLRVTAVHTAINFFSILA